VTCAPASAAWSERFRYCVVSVANTMAMCSDSTGEKLGHSKAGSHATNNPRHPKPVQPYRLMPPLSFRMQVCHPAKQAILLSLTWKVVAHGLMCVKEVLPWQAMLDFLTLVKYDRCCASCYLGIIQPYLDRRVHAQHQLHDVAYLF
jgi:hypothetical protein